MKQPNRELLVLFNETIMPPKAIEYEVEQLHALLCTVERLNNLVAAHEIININKYRVINKPLALRTFLRQKQTKPFVFLNCKN